MNQLDAIGGYVEAEPVAREVTIGDKKATFYFRELGYPEFRKITQTTPEDGKLKELVMLGEIVRVGDAGQDTVPYDDLCRVRRPVIDELSRIAWEVNGVIINVRGESDLKNSPSKMSSGTSLPPSLEEPSENSSDASPKPSSTGG